jgi:ClpP class serine protease
VIDVLFTVITDDSATFIVEMIALEREDDSIKGVVIKLDSPGGVK